MADWLDEIEAQADETSPYYLPRLIAEIRRLRALADRDQVSGAPAGGRPHSERTVSPRQLADQAGGRG